MISCPMYTKNVSPSYFNYMFIFFCFKPGKVKNNVVYFFPFRKGLALIFLAQFLPHLIIFKMSFSLSPFNEKQTSLNYLIVLLASSVEIMEEMILLLQKKMDLSKMKVKQL